MKKERFYNYLFTFDKVDKKRVNVLIERVGIRYNRPVKTLYGYSSKKEAMRYAKQYLRDWDVNVIMASRLYKLSELTRKG